MASLISPVVKQLLGYFKESNKISPGQHRQVLDFLYTHSRKNNYQSPKAAEVLDKFPYLKRLIPKRFHQGRFGGSLSFAARELDQALPGLRNCPREYLYAFLSRIGEPRPLEEIKFGQLRANLHRAMHLLTANEIIVATDNFGLNSDGKRYTNTELMKRLDVNESRVKQIRSRALNKLGSQRRMQKFLMPRR